MDTSQAVLDGLDFRDRILFMKRNHIRFHARDPLAAQRLQSLSLSLCSYRLSSSSSL